MQSKASEESLSRHAPAWDRRTMLVIAALWAYILVHLVRFVRQSGRSPNALVHAVHCLAIGAVGTAATVAASGALIWALTIAVLGLALVQLSWAVCRPK